MFGTFDEMPLPDVLSLIEGSSGQLQIWSSNREHHYEIETGENQITRLTFNQQEIAEVNQAKSFIIDLFKATDSEFEYHRGETQSPFYNLQIEEILISGLLITDEILTLQPHFPEPETIFVATSSQTGWVDPELQDFWKQAAPFLEQGASAQDLFDQLGLYLDQIQLKLYKLRAAHYIEPKRAFNVPKPKKPDPTTKTQVMEEVLSELTFDAKPENKPLNEIAASLEPIWQDQPAPTDSTAVDAPKPPQAPQTQKKLSSVQPYQANKTVMNSLVGSLKNLISRNT